jgi:mannonate dehydratase
MSCLTLAEFLPPVPSPLWSIVRQAGVDHAIVKVAPELTGLPDPWSLPTLRLIVDRFRASGIVVAGLEGDPFDMSRIKLGLPGRDDDIDRYRSLLDSMSQLGITLLCYNFMLGTGWFRSGESTVRGGALGTHFRAADAPESIACGTVDADRAWSNYEYFLRAVNPHALRVGVRMALHPDDPPIERLSGVSRIFGSVDAFDRAYAIAPNRANAVTYCQANFKLAGCDLQATARHFGDRIAFIHVRDVRGTKEDFIEVFHDETDVDQPALFDLYVNELKLDVPVRSDHVPTMTGDALITSHLPGYGTLGRLLAIGYFKGILQARGLAYR